MGALLDARKPLTTHYGAIQGMAALGPRAGLLLLMPKLNAVYAQLVPVLQQVRSAAFVANTSMSASRLPGR